ncbi:phosphatase PAP2 family protein [Halegenticoccus tardaugens]|uniref:phosphatase PAP2 family protein n=1 Tax=Halegenticoccus tardaugens TaxID=2071624 RepID=UPI00100AF3F6|nr:phosphatase PAP2 family protein [Halegenticoccus tardaugens]
MSLLTTLAEVVAVVLVLGAGAAYGIVGVDRLRRLRRTLRGRLRAVAPQISILAVVLLVNSAIRDVVPEFSWLIGWNITGYIYALEGEFVPFVQSFATPPLTAYFSYVYVYGYVFLLVFPLLAYAALDDARPLRELVIAYSLNYALGLVCYVFFIAYGPRNLLSDLVDSLLFTTYPRFQLLTAQVNTNTNVFPSLHTSLSVTVAALAWRSREVYPRWTALAGVLALSIVISTMYLGIHWATDVVAGVALAALSVKLATRWAADDDA